MKKLLLGVWMAILCLLMSCEDRVVTKTVVYQVNEPVFMTAAEFRNSVKITQEPQEINQRGKMCFYQDYLFISESTKGVHIVDNKDPSNPQKVGFIELLGNADLTVRNDILYADSYIDLVWFDISNPQQPVLRGRLENVFMDGLPPTGNEYGIDYSMCYGTSPVPEQIVVSWKLTERREEIEEYQDRGIWFLNSAGDKSFAMESSVGGGNAATGVTGSMSRFGLYKNYLYAIINNALTIFDLSGSDPVKARENMFMIGNIETIFSYKDYMFMGAPMGMYIYSVENPLEPVYISELNHVYGCDPVVVEDDIAYVTIHSGDFCGQNNNELFIVDVSDVYNPRQLVSYTMTHPKGLGIDNKTLFVCDDGLKIFNAENPQTIIANQLAHYKGMDGFDVIPFKNVLMMIANDGLYQYDYSNLDNIRQLSKLSFK